MIVFSSLADRDIEGILDYTVSNFGIKKAESYYHGMKEKFDSMDDSMSSGFHLIC